MTEHTHQALRAQLEASTDDGLRRIIELLERSIQEHEAELAHRQAQLSERRRELALAQEVAAARPGLLEPEFQARWRELLDTLNRSPDRFERLEQALNEFMLGRHPLIRQDFRIRTDNRQSLLALFVPKDPQALEALYGHLLKLLPVLVNEANPDETQQAAVLNVLARDIGDKEWLTLLAHPRLSRFEVTRSWRREEEVVFRGATLRETLQYLSEHFPYWG